MKLSIDLKRLVEIKPVETKWLREGVTLYLPEASKNKFDCTKHKGTAFLPPKLNYTKAEFKSWVEKKSKYINKAFKNSKGGGLALCTSYEQVDTLFHFLSNSFKDSPKIIVIKSTQGKSIRMSLDEYTKIYKSGQRPLWIAITNAGTGIDISDKSLKAKDDYMLQDLFITRAPISPKSKDNYINVVRDAIILMRQWLGRIIRREGRITAKIHILDARMNVSTGAMKPFQTQILKYKKIVNINYLNP